eukprot:TRINITY_DN8930_c0_g1_i3.p1 TRINITY_DN8930_c0_g1~~TRINITY_DN8930_c0_g1_i3.p1  ORF type:complete len:620 (-),score=105.07 TRINITY_DN8930_c0_g1_i3:30-1772(-)
MSKSKQPKKKPKAEPKTEPKVAKTEPKTESSSTDIQQPSLERQTSGDYADWYHDVPQEDVWGGSDDWDDGSSKSGKAPKASKQKPTKKKDDGKGKSPKTKDDDDDLWGDGGDGGDEGGSGGGGWDDDDLSATTEKEEEVVVKTPYRILDSKQIVKKRDKVIEEQTELLGLSKNEMDLLLRYLRYDQKKIDLFLADTKNQADVRLQSGIRGSAKRAKPHKEKTVQCSTAMCDVVKTSDAHALDCGHYLCKDCWKGFLQSEIGAGVATVFSKCPAQDDKGKKCQEPVDYDTMKKFLTVAELAKLDGWILDQYVQSATNLKWCPKPGCNYAAEYERGDACDVYCKCGQSFCFHCQVVAHSPAPCDLAKKWGTLTNDAEAASERLIQSLTKPCPKCGTRIEKNRQCNHMKCSKCNFDFCWQCLQAITIGTTHPSWYVCKVREQAQAEGKLDKDEEERVNLNKFLAKLSLHKAHVEDCQKDRKASELLIPKISSVEGTMSDGRTLNWLTAIAKAISESHRFLEWSWVYSYFMADSNRKETFVNWQKILEEKADGTLHDIEKALNKQIGRAVQQECRDRSRMPSSA